MTTPAPRRRSILLVDDEEMTLKYFVKAFSDEFPVLTAPSVDAALKVIAEQGDHLAVVISDQRMPGATGVELLAWINANRPDLIRILATAYAENEATVQAVNAGHIYRYVHKPWDIKELRQTLLRALDLYELQRERDRLLREKLSTLRRMVVADRVRSYAMLANGLAHRIHNSVQALKAFLDFVPADMQAEETVGQVQWDDLWSMAQREGQRVVDVVQGVIDRTIEPVASFASCDAAALAQREVTAALTGGPALDATIPAGLPAPALDAGRAGRLFRILAERIRRIDPAAKRVALAAAPAEVWGTPGLRISLTVPGSTWDQEQLRACFAALSPRADASAPGVESDLLAAYFIAYHHGGNLIIHRGAPHGPGFEVLLPIDPAAARIPEPDPLWTERIFTAFDL